MHARRFLAPENITDVQIPLIAERNFRLAALYVVKNFHLLPINLETAITLNKIISKDLVPEELLGKFDHRPRGEYSHLADSFVGTTASDFYLNWLISPHANQLFRNNPIRFADILHNSIATFDSFPDGNGRLSRLFADFVLLKAGLSPASYTTMDDYFARGNARAPVKRTARQDYFEEAVERGQNNYQQYLSRH